MNKASNDEPTYLERSKRFYKIYGGLILFSLLCSMTLKPILGQSDLFHLLVGGPVIAMIVMAPIGLVYSWKSNQRKEGRALTRFKYFIGHFIFTLLTVLLIASMIKDFAQLLK